MEQYNENQLDLEEEVFGNIINLEDLKSDFKEIFAEYIEKEEIDDYKNFLREELIKKLKTVTKFYNFTVLEDFFHILIDLWINRSPEKANSQFLTLGDIYDIFFVYDFRIIPLKIINELLGGLQWNMINSEWINDNFIFEYFKTLPNNIEENLKVRTWNLVELTRIKSKE